jgi:hypothetical protein
MSKCFECLAKDGSEISLEAHVRANQKDVAGKESKPRRFVVELRLGAWLRCLGNKASC